MNGSHSDPQLRDSLPLDDDQLQSHLLQGVSRTFALTIPQLPAGLARAVSNAYLLCRIVDTIEDEVSLDSAQKRHFCGQFIEVVAGRAPAAALADDLAPRLSDTTLPAEHELIRLIPRVIAITHALEPAQREALSLCVEIMGQGMAEFQDRDLRNGLATMAEMDRYCYYVAGVVGEMLTRLFCHYSPEIAVHRERLMALAVSFGQGLQMTNILKDLWDDHDRQVCWLPQEIFDATGYRLADLVPNHNDPRFRDGFRRLIATAHGHLANALEYSLLIPARETGIREFCLWALGMAVLTLRKLNANLDFSASSQVKISRNSVKATIAVSRVSLRSNVMLQAAFYLAGLGLPRTDRHALIAAAPTQS
ncbi:MAG: phytoene/squalene synthase family protein [Methylococcaceae bacterium]|nr:phytoene/squalene synthase family protein [Methylococcaceae bacterium]